MAFVHAISSAGVAHALTRACSSGELENCGCDRSLRGTSPEGFEVRIMTKTGLDVLCEVKRHLITLLRLINCPEIELVRLIKYAFKQLTKRSSLKSKYGKGNPAFEKT